VILFKDLEKNVQIAIIICVTFVILGFFAMITVCEWVTV
jgi:hypothetical protein